jgi:hypothetical protein
MSEAFRLVAWLHVPLALVCGFQHNWPQAAANWATAAFWMLAANAEKCPHSGSGPKETG